MISRRSWIGIDLDGTLAYYNHLDFDPDCIGDPIPEMVNRVKRYLNDGLWVKIFTDRVAWKTGIELEDTIKIIQNWTEEHIGERLEVTCQKDRDMLMFFDDRAIQVIQNTGLTTVQFLRDE